MNDLIENLYEAFVEHPIVVTDSRKIVPDCIFFGLEGSKVDGSAYGFDAVTQGAAFAVVKKDACQAHARVCFVEDPLSVLQDLARYHRSHLSIPFLGITGSNGKTTTKELIARVLGKKFNVLATRGNLNNHIGVPLTVLSVTSFHELAIIEMGANHQGEIAMLCSIARPTLGIVTNIGKAHLEGFGGPEGVKKAKGELFDYLASAGGTALVNADEHFLQDLSSKVGDRILYGFEHATTHKEYRFAAVSHDQEIHMQWKDSAGHVHSVVSTLFGRFNLANIATAVAAGIYFQVDGQSISDAIRGYVPDNNRAQSVERGSNRLILDAYNANPTSMLSALETFRSMDHPKKVVILGNMMELGQHTGEEHEQIARFVHEMQVIDTWLVGEHFRESAGRLGKKWVPDVETLIPLIRAENYAHALVLIKGSRSVHLEDVLAAFQ